MFEYHGWVTIRETAGPDDDPARLRSCVEEVRRLLAEPGAYGLLDLRWTNGVPILQLAGTPNRQGVWGGQVVGLFRRIGEIAPGSYGLLYLRDDEDEDATRANGFTVLRLARGVVTEHADVLLSPFVPSVEDAWPAP